jgi:hypothetical protein
METEKSHVSDEIYYTAASLRFDEAESGTKLYGYDRDEESIGRVRLIYSSSSRSPSIGMILLERYLAASYSSFFTI